jgi:hypothetical protein
MESVKNYVKPLKKQLKRGGTAMFAARKKKTEEQEVEEAQEALLQFQADDEEPERLMEVPAEKVSAGKWRVHGMYEEQALKAGLRRLDNEWETRGLFSKRQTSGRNVEKTKSTPRFVCEGLIADLVSGDRGLNDVHKSDVSSAQGDLVHLTARQLLRLRVNNLDYAPQGDDNAAMHAFMHKLDRLLFEQLGQMSVASLFPNMEASDCFRLGKDLTFVSAVAANITHPSWWVCWAGYGEGQKRFYFHPGNFAASKEFPKDRDGWSGVLEIEDVSRMCHMSRGKHWILDWNVRAIMHESELRSKRIAPSRDVNEAAAGAGGVAGAPRMGVRTLKRIIGNMKVTNTELWTH